MRHEERCLQQLKCTWMKAALRPPCFGKSRGGGWSCSSEGTRGWCREELAGAERALRVWLVRQCWQALLLCQLHGGRDILSGGGQRLVGTAQPGMQDPGRSLCRLILLAAF